MGVLHINVALMDSAVHMRNGTLPHKMPQFITEGAASLSLLSLSSSCCSGLLGHRAVVQGASWSPLRVRDVGAGQAMTESMVPEGE
jgi:hypothetical protein